MAPNFFTPAWLMRSSAPIHNSRSGLTGFLTKTGTSTPLSESARACMANGLADVRAPTQRMSMPYFSASSTCSGVATSVETSIPVSFFTCCSQGSATSPLPSKPPGFVRGFHTPARKLWHPLSASSRAVVITCSSVSAEQGPAMTNGLSLSLGNVTFSSSNSMILFFLFIYSSYVLFSNDIFRISFLFFRVQLRFSPLWRRARCVYIVRLWTRR